MKRWTTDLFGAKVAVVIPDLKDQAYQIHQRQDVVRCWTGALHQSSRQPKQTSGLVRDHEQVFILRWHSHSVTPEQLDALPTM